MIKYSKPFLLICLMSLPAFFGNGAWQLSGETNASARQYPYEQVKGLYYFTDQGLMDGGQSGKPVKFDETLHGGPAIDFKNQLAFTFDDVVFGPYLDDLLKILRDHRIKAVFFLTVTHMAATDQTVIAGYLRKILAEGHVLGNHTWGHDTLDRGRFGPGKTGALESTRAEFLRLEQTVDHLLGYHYQMEYWRPPFGIRGNQGVGLGERMSIPGRVDQLCLEERRELILWHINSLDFLMAYPEKDPNHLSSHQAASACLERIKASKGGVILFHANKRTPAMLGEVLSGLSGQAWGAHYRFATIADLLEIKYGTAKP